MSHDEVLNLARLHCGDDADEARSLILGMPGTSANYLMVIDAILESAKGETWGDFDEVTEALEAAFKAMSEVRAMSEEERQEGYRAAMREAA